MADIVLTQGQSLPETMQTTYKDLGDGTHALVIEFVPASGASDITISQGQSLPSATRTRYVDKGDGTHALQLTRG
jgi:hypothetical protein